MYNNNYLDEEKGDTKPFLEEIVNGVNEHKNIENDCVLTKINNSNIRNKKTTRKLKFSRGENSNILNNKRLSDESIDLAQQLLKKQFPIFGGLQGIALSEHYGLDVVKKDKPFIQVLYNGSVHWIGYVYLILIETGLKTILAIFWILYLEVKLQKMLRRKYVPNYSYLCKEPVIKVVVNLVQQQGNGVDCIKYYLARDSGFKIQDSRFKF